MSDSEVGTIWVLEFNACWSSQLDYICFTVMILKWLHWKEINGGMMMTGVNWLTVGMYLIVSVCLSVFLSVPFFISMVWFCYMYLDQDNWISTLDYMNFHDFKVQFLLLTVQWSSSITCYSYSASAQVSHCTIPLTKWYHPVVLITEFVCVKWITQLGCDTVQCWSPVSQIHAGQFVKVIFFTGSTYFCPNNTLKNNKAKKCFQR